MICEVGSTWLAFMVFALEPAYLAEGSAAALGLGTKVVIVLTGLVAAGVTTVILPHFSALMGHMGVGGIALATSLATAVSTCIMLLLFNRLGHISGIDLIMIALSWMLFSTLVICVQYQSYAGAAVSALALAVLVGGQLNLLLRWRSAA